MKIDLSIALAQMHRWPQHQENYQVYTNPWYAAWWGVRAVTWHDAGVCESWSVPREVLLFGLSSMKANQDVIQAQLMEECNEAG